MKLDAIHLTKEEMGRVISEYFGIRGMKIEVTKVDIEGYPVKGFYVSCEGHAEEEAEQPAPPKVL